MREIWEFDECVSDNVPLALSQRRTGVFPGHEFGNLHPFQLSVSSDGLHGLQQVFNLRNSCLEEQE